MKSGERISKRVNELPEPRIDELIVKGHLPGYISLGPGEPDFPAPGPVVSHAKKVLARSSHYSSPEGEEEFLEAAAAKLKKENGIDCSPENIVATTGSTEGIFLALASLIDPGEHVIIPDPGFMDYIPTVEFLGGHPALLELAEEEKWEPNTEKLMGLIDKGRTKAIIVNTPSNPTGTVFSKKTLEEIATVAVENDLFIISDEAYEKFVYDDAKHISIGSLNGLGDRVITLQTLSKTFAMCGWRIAYACAPAGLAKAIAKAHIYTSLTASTPAQAVGAFALRELDRAYIEKMRNEYDKRRKLMVQRLNEMGLPTAEPKGAFYTFSNIKEFSSSSNHFVDTMMKKAKVVVMPGTEFGKHGEGYIRCSYATSMKKIEEALDRMENVLKHRWV